MERKDFPRGTSLARTCAETNYAFINCNNMAKIFAKRKRRKGEGRKFLADCKKGGNKIRRKASPRIHERVRALRNFRQAAQRHITGEKNKETKSM